MSSQIVDVVDDITWTTMTTRMGFAGFTILIWDHIVTFNDEVDLIWRREKCLFVYLFLLNRYLTPLGFMVNLYAYLSPAWTNESCEHFVRYEGSMTVIGIEITAVMMLLRVRAIYAGKKYATWVVASILLVETAVNAWLLTNGEAVPHASRSIRACTMIYQLPGGVASVSAWLPLLYDTVVLVLTFALIYGPLRRREAGLILKTLLADGFLYYSVILSVTLVLTVMIIKADPGLKNMMAQLELLLTVTMMSRITINLRKQGRAFFENDIVLPVNRISFKAPVAPQENNSFYRFGSPRRAGWRKGPDSEDSGVNLAEMDITEVLDIDIGMDEEATVKSPPSR